MWSVRPVFCCWHGVPLTVLSGRNILDQILFKMFSFLQQNMASENPLDGVGYFYRQKRYPQTISAAVIRFVDDGSVDRTNQCPLTDFKMPFK